MNALPVVTEQSVTHLICASPLSLNRCLKRRWIVVSMKKATKQTLCVKRIHFLVELVLTLVEIQQKMIVMRILEIWIRNRFRHFPVLCPYQRKPSPMRVEFLLFVAQIQRKVSQFLLRLAVPRRSLTLKPKIFKQTKILFQ